MNIIIRYMKKKDNETKNVSSRTRKQRCAMSFPTYLLALSSRQLLEIMYSSASSVHFFITSSLCERSGRRQPPAERSPCIYDVAPSQGASWRGEDSLDTGSTPTSGGEIPKMFHHPDIPLWCSQLITGNPYNTQPSSYPHHIQAYNQQPPCFVKDAAWCYIVISSG